MENGGCVKNLSLSTTNSVYLFNILEGKSILLVSIYTMSDKQSVEKKQNQTGENMYLDGSILSKEKFLYTLTFFCYLQRNNYIGIYEFYIVKQPQNLANVKM